MSKAIDLTGKKFGRLTALYPLEKREHKCIVWMCQCDCGNTKAIRGDHLRDGSIKSCGCLHAENCKKVGLSNLIDMSGKRFGKWTVLKRDPSYIGDKAKWICQCDCGTIKSVDGDDLRFGESVSCGCEILSHGALKIKNILEQNNIKYQLEYKFQNLIGKQNVPYRFDFAVFKENELNCLIEYDSSIHYLTSGYITKENLKEIQQRDKEKNLYCINNDIKLFRIPYFELYKINTWEDLVQDKYRVWKG